MILFQNLLNGMDFRTHVKNGTRKNHTNIFTRSMLTRNWVSLNHRISLLKSFRIRMPKLVYFFLTGISLSVFRCVRQERISIRGFVRRSVGPSVRPSVGPSVRPSVRHTLLFCTITSTLRSF